MKATGIVRRIDDLGRVVIPKEIRRTLRIREGDPLEIFTDREGEVILKKYSPIGELGELAGIYAESIAQTMGCTVCITDTDQVIAAAGNGKKELHEKYIGKALEEVMKKRVVLFADSESNAFVSVTDASGNYTQEVISPIVCEGDVIGSVILLNREEKTRFGDSEKKVAISAADFLGRQMEQ